MAAAAGRCGTRFCLHHTPAARTPRALVVHVHPFAEEMNKARRMAALQARALADAGCGVLQIDLLGCGDSSGDFGDASWDDWVDDIVHACRWLQQRGDAPLWLWGLRSGCLLAAAAARQLDTACHCLFWQPSAQGRPVLQQFLRLRTVAGALAGGARDGTAELMRRLEAGESIEVAGYTLAPALALGLARAMLDPPARAGRLELIDLSTQPDAALSPASAAAALRWQSQGWDVRSRVASGPAFWHTTEIEVAPALLAASVAALDESAHA